MTAPFLSKLAAKRLDRIFDIATYVDPMLMVTEVFKDGTATVWTDGTGFIIWERSLFTNFVAHDHDDVRDWTHVILAKAPGVYQGTILTAFDAIEVSELFLTRIVLKHGWRDDI